MEEAPSRPGHPGDRAQAAAEKLRALRERANQAIEEHRRRLSQIEAELSDRVRQLAAEYDGAAAGIEKRSSDGSDADVVALRRQLEESRRKHDQFVEQLALARRQLDAIQAEPCPACGDAARQLTDAHEEARQLRNQVAAVERQREEDLARNEKIAEQVAAARQAIGELQVKSREETALLQAELDKSLAAKAAAEEQAAALARDIEVLHAEYDELQDRASALEQSSSASVAEQRRAAEAAVESARSQAAELQVKLQAAQAATAKAEQTAQAARQDAEEAKREKSELQQRLDSVESLHAAEFEEHGARAAAAEKETTSLCDQLSATAAEIDSLKRTLAETTAARDDLQGAVEAARRRINELEREAAESVPDLERQFVQFKKDVAAAEEARAAAVVSLDAAHAELAELRSSSRPQSDFDALQSKFDSVLSDVEQLKRQNGELHDKLATRAEAAEVPSPELLALRRERDELAARVVELEAAPPTLEPDPAWRQAHEDLQRRLDMTLDDLRQAKQESQSLRDQLAARSAAGASAGGSDWASQRARLVAMLEEEEAEGVTDSARRKERATIENTIAATDRALAEKDRELVELRSGGGPSANAVEGEELRLRLAAVDADELIAAEREKLAKLQTEWEQKLRAAELEFSVERAKLAREQAALKERMFELQKAGSQSPLANGDDGKPRRRWLAALGLGDENEERQADAPQ